MSRILNLSVMRNLVVSGLSTLARLKARLEGVDKTLNTINASVYTLSDVNDISVGATGTGQTSSAVLEVIGVNGTDSQITVSVTSGTFALNETIRFSTPYISADDDAVITVGAAKSDPALLGNIGQGFASGLNSKVDWNFFGYDGSIEYGAGVVINTRETVIIRRTGGEEFYYTLNLSSALPYTIDGDINNDLPNFTVLDGVQGIRGDRGLQGPAGTGQQYAWRFVSNASNSGEKAVIAQDGIFTDTRTATLDLSLPANPQPNDIFAVTDLYGTWGINRLRLLRNGKKIMNLEEDMDLLKSWAEYEFVYVNDSFGWRIIR